jgi:ABC-type dipeptide/oligopeptide/nickel transport system permease component
MIDVFDIMAFVVFAVLIAVAVIIVVSIGQLPGKIALKRDHPQAAAINVTSWLGVATLGFLWPVALIWAFLKPVSLLPAKSKENQEAQS